MTDGPCPICRHPLGGHGPACTEAGCACIYDPRGKRVIEESRRPLAFGSFEGGQKGTEKQRVPLRASYFKARRSGRGWLLLLGLLLIAAAAVWRLKG